MTTNIAEYDELLLMQPRAVEWGKAAQEWRA